MAIRITYVGHATVLIEMDGTRLLTDPILRGRVAHLRRHTGPWSGLLGEIDGVLISHAHMDHLDMRSLNQLAEGTLLVAPRGTARPLRKRFQVSEVDEDESIRLGALDVTATHAEHDGRRYAVGKPVPALGFLVAGTHRVFFAGDTDLFDGMADIGRAGVDLALLPVSGWGSRLPPGHLTPRTAAESLQRLAPRVVIPIHWGTLAPMRARRRSDMQDAPAREFAAHAAAMAPNTEVIVVSPGDSVELWRDAGAPV